MAKYEELVVIDRMCELVRWYIDRLAKFPRCRRYGIGARLKQGLYTVLEDLIRAKYSPRETRAALLTGTNLDLQVVRMLTRLANELRIHSCYNAQETNAHCDPARLMQSLPRAGHWENRATCPRYRGDTRW